MAQKEKLNPAIIDMKKWISEHGDYIVRGITSDGGIRAFAATTKNLVQEAQDRHDTSPTATAALGRLLTAGAMMGTMLKGADDLVTIMMRGDGPMAGITVTADSYGDVKGFVSNPQVWLPEKTKGHLDVGGAIGHGVLTVVRDQEFGEPYSSQVNLVSGEIAEDLTYYFATSEQIPSSVGLGVLTGPGKQVRNAGGFIIQLMPGCTDETIDKLEAKLKTVHSITEYLEKGMKPEDILNDILGEFGLEILDTLPTQFYCNCSHERMSKALVTLGKKELNAMIDDGKPVTLSCQFCGRSYTFPVDELKEILKTAEASDKPDPGQQ
ncbi:MAG: Hsp33 family molecular chaperone HslO [Eubacteriales bacterium]|jgi:molecular chaperone Hsp33